MQETKQCSKCKKVKNLSEYHKQKDTPLGVRSSCRECQKKSQRTWYYADAEKHRERRRAQYDPARSKIYNARHMAKMRIAKYGAPEPLWERTKTLKAKKSPTMIDIGWMAGFFEGEGSFSVPWRMTISQVQREPLERVLELFGGRLHGPFLPKKSVRAPNGGQPYYRWDVSGVRARGIAQTIFALLSPRRQEQFKRAFINPPRTPGH